MDEATKKIALSLISGILRKVALIAAGSLATHGVAVSGNFTEIFVSLGVAAVVGGYSLWKDYGRAIVLTQLQVWKAKALAQQDAMRRANVPQPTHVEIADKSPDPAVTAATVAKVVSAGCLALALLAGLAPAMAQTQAPRRPLTGNIVKDIKSAVDGGQTGVGGAIGDKAFQALAKPFQDIAKFIGDDAEGAVALATVVPEIQDGHGQQCWMEMASFGRIAKVHPLPLTLRVMTDMESLRLLAIATNRLCANVHCTQVFADASAMAQAASPVPLLIPTLHDLCTKVPQIAIVDPVAAAPPASK